MTYLTFEEDLPNSSGQPRHYDPSKNYPRPAYDPSQYYPRPVTEGEVRARNEFVTAEIARLRAKINAEAVLRQVGAIK